jgi:hypothetical protein
MAENMSRREFLNAAGKFSVAAALTAIGADAFAQAPQQQEISRADFEKKAKDLHDEVLKKTNGQPGNYTIGEGGMAVRVDRLENGTPYVLIGDPANAEGFYGFMHTDGKIAGNIVYGGKKTMLWQDSAVPAVDQQTYNGLEGYLNGVMNRGIVQQGSVLNQNAGSAPNQDITLKTAAKTVDEQKIIDAGRTQNELNLIAQEKELVLQIRALDYEIGRYDKKEAIDDIRLKRELISLEQRKTQLDRQRIQLEKERIRLESDRIKAEYVKAQQRNKQIRDNTGTVKRGVGDITGTIRDIDKTIKQIKKGR